MQEQLSKSQKQARELAKRMLYAAKDENAPFTRDDLEAVVKAYIGITTKLGGKVLPHYQRYQIANLAGLLEQEGYIIPDGQDPKLLRLNVPEIRAIKEAE